MEQWGGKIRVTGMNTWELKARSQNQALDFSRYGIVHSFAPPRRKSSANR
jgi:hypothetical protein